MALPIESVLGIDQLTGLVADPMGGVPTPTMPAGFLTTTRQVPQRTSYYQRVTHLRSTAQLTDPDAPSKPSKQGNAGKIPVTLAHYREFDLHGPELMMQLLSPGSDMIQQMGVREIGRKTMNLNRRFDNARIATISSAILTGHIYFDGQGNLLPSSSGSVTDVDFNVPTNNTNNKNIGGWDTTSTDIAGQIADERRRLNQLTGLRYNHVVYGTNIPNYLGLNDSFKEYIKGSPALSQAFAANQIPQNFVAAGLTWWDCTDKWYEDADGTIQNWVPDDGIVLLPDPTDDWYEIQEGPYIIPEDLGSVYGGAESAVSGFAMVSGRFSYAMKSTDPPGIKQIVGDTFLPVIKVPGAIRRVADVTQAAT